MTAKELADHLRALVPGGYDPDDRIPVRAGVLLDAACKIDALLAIAGAGDAPVSATDHRILVQVAGFMVRGDCIKVVTEAGFPDLAQDFKDRAPTPIPELEQLREEGRQQVLRYLEGVLQRTGTRPNHLVKQKEFVEGLLRNARQVHE